MSAADPRTALVTRALERLATRLADDQGLAERVAVESALHPFAARTALTTWIESIDSSTLGRLRASATHPPGGRQGVTTLAPGNIPIVAAECLILGWLAEIRHRLAMSTRATVLARALHSEMVALDEDVGGTVDLQVWRAMGAAGQRAWLEGAERVVVYGTADTVEWVAASIPEGVTVVPHGPSVAAAFLDAEAHSEEERSALLADLAMDVALFEQRGCRSPHVLCVAGTEPDAEVVGEELGRALDRITRTLPPPAAREPEAATLFLDRMTSATLGHVLEGDGWCVTIETAPVVARPSPLGRTVRVLLVDSPAAMSALLSSLPAPVGLLLTADGIAPPAVRLPAAAEVASLGSAHGPPFDRRHDGRHRLDELLG